MLAVHGLTKIVDRSMKEGTESAYINLVLETQMLKELPNGKTKLENHRFNASMYFKKDQHNKMAQWFKKLEPGRLLEIRHAELSGHKPKETGEWDGWVHIKLSTFSQYTVIR
jgi:hypothetical protein